MKEKKDAKETPNANSAKTEASEDGVLELDVDTDDAGVSSELESVKNELTKAKNDYLYLAAEFENYKRNAIKERSELIKYGAERFVRPLLDVVDNFDRAMASELNESNIDVFKNGMSLIHRELAALLERMGLSVVACEGKPFDPSVHEAISSEESDAAPGTVTRVFKKAYRLHDRLIRPAQVVVAKAPSATPSPTTGEGEG